LRDFSWGVEWGLLEKLRKVLSESPGGIMSDSVTAKVICNLKSSYGDGKTTTLGFCADYQDGRNKDWSPYTPHLDLRMTVTGDVGNSFEMGKSYTLTFTPDNNTN
jgi:hypothetical protein